MKSCLIILGDQLFPMDFYESHVALKSCHVFMAEDWDLCTHYKYHKHKITFFLTAMRDYADDLRKKGANVYYKKLTQNISNSNESSDEEVLNGYLFHLKEFVDENHITKIYFSEIQDKFFESKLLSFFKRHNIQFECIGTPMFLSDRNRFKEYLASHKKPFMKTFYEEERKRLDILLSENAEPIGGKWSFDTENRKKPPKVFKTVKRPALKNSPNLSEVSHLVSNQFSDHPGSIDDFWIPTSRKEALEYLKHFTVHHLSNFGDFQDSITNRDVFLYHSILSPFLNAGLLTPKEVIGTVLEHFQNNKDIPLASVEGFIRQVMGWREFVRGIYQNFSERQEKTNFFDHHRKLTQDWYVGSTGIGPVDDAIKKANKWGLCHHIERLMILSNMMLLSEIHPQEVHRWFMEMFIDSADWVMGPNVYGMGQFSDGGLFATKPYISGSNYILKMSDYKKDSWCDIWDGLFWRFIHKNRKFFLKNYRLSMMVRTFDKMKDDKKDRLFKLAEVFINEKTS